MIGGEALSKLFSGFSIRKQILIGFTPILIVLMLLAFVSNYNFGVFFTQSQMLKSATQSSIHILEIDRKIVELQRNVLVYSYIGYSGVLRKIEYLQGNIEEKLALLDNNLKGYPEKERDVLTRLTKHYEGYKELFGDAVIKRIDLLDVKKELSDPTYEQIESVIVGMIESAKKSKSYDSALKLSDIKHQLLLAHMNYSSFLSTPDAKIIGKTKIIIKKSIDSIQKIEAFNENNQQKIGLKKLKILAKEYENAFIKMVNINRGYLALINVVMAGKAAEIEALTKKLDVYHKSNLKIINKEIERNMLISQEHYRVLSLFAALIGIIAALWIASGISKPVQRMANTLTRLARGEKEIDIPGTDRHDEVGKMATAANEFKEMAQSLERQKSLLEKTIKQAEFAKEDAIKANNSKSDFLASMSHEIRTPMNGIFGMSELVMEESLSEKQKKNMTSLMNSAEALLIIIDDILDFSKIEAGKLELDPTAFDLKNMVEEIIDIMAIKIQDNNVELTIQYDEKIGSVIIGDPVRIRQIITNLVGNATKFTKNGHISISIKGFLDNDSKSLIKFSVEDTGIGIAKEVQSSIFDKFSQADNSTTRKFGGTGLGLAICKKLAKMMGGEIGLESEVGKGSTFWFTIALYSSDEIIENKKALDYSMLEGLDALIIDDLDTYDVIFNELLSSLGISCTICRNAYDAIKEFDSKKSEGNPYDFCIIDYIMPVINGMTLSEVFNEDDDNSNTTFILMSSYNEVDKIYEIEKTGFNAHIPKPIKKTSLEAILLKSKERECNFSVDGVKVLVAEDNRVNQEVIKQMLSNLGCIVDIAVNGEEAVKKARNTDYDIILMDCQMPVMDGYDATQKIIESFSDNVSSQPPIVALTANAMKGDKEQCLKVGMNDYLSKPVRKENLFSMLKKWAFVKQKNANLS